MAGSNVIEIDPPDADVARYFCASKREPRYLALLDRHVRPPALEKVAPGSIHVLQAEGQLTQNNADVLICSGSALKHLVKSRSYGGARQIVSIPRTPMSFLGACGAWLYLLASRRLRSARLRAFSTTSGRRRFALAGEVRKRKKHAARYYINPHMGVRGFFDALNRRGVRYALLRWFDRAENLPWDEDLDILVADEHCPKVQAMLSNQPGVIPCDLYSCSGLPGSDFRRMAYYPPELAEGILDRRVLHQGWCYVPSRRDHFFSLAYHAIYHKGLRSGLIAQQSGSAAPKRYPEHDYHGELARLAAELGFNAELSLEGLHALLKESGWTPPRDTLQRLTRRNPWLRTVAAPEPKRTGPGEVMVFVLRDYAVQRAFEDEIVQLIEHERLTVLRTKRLGDEEKRTAARAIRGGNWGKGPWPVGAGGPSSVIVAFDYNPRPADKKLKRRYPHVHNRNVFVKHTLRERFNARRPASEHTNFIHSSDNEAEAWDYVQATMPEAAGELQSLVQQIRRRWSTPERVLRSIPTKCTRSKLELIEYRGGRALKKTFKHNCDRFLQREIYVMDQFSRRCPAIPPLLEAGPNYVIMPWYENTFRFHKRRFRRVPRAIGREALNVMRFFYDEGLALVDFQPKNVLVDRREGFKVVDFEFLYRYRERPDSFLCSYDIAGVPDDFDGDLPRTIRPPGVTYESHWKPYLRVPVEELLKSA